MRSVTVNLTTFELNDANNKSAKTMVKRVDWELELKSQKQQNVRTMHLKNTSWSPGGSWWTKFHCVVHP